MVNSMVIGMVGLSGSGKDTVADMICEALGYKKASFADKLHFIVSETLGFDSRQRETKEIPVTFTSDMLDKLRWMLGVTFFRYPEVNQLIDETLGYVKEISPRQLLQTIGTDIGRKLDENAWITTQHATVFSDVRFANEARVCDVLVFVNRDVPVLNHVSEKLAFDMRDKVEFEHIPVLRIENDSTLEVLFERTSKVIEQLKGMK